MPANRKEPLQAHFWFQSLFRGHGPFMPSGAPTENHIRPRDSSERGGQSSLEQNRHIPSPVSDQADDHPFLLDLINDSVGLKEYLTIPVNAQIS